MTVPVYNMTDTWNDSGTTFAAIQMNVTNTASAAASKLIDLQVGATSLFNVGVANSTNSGPQLQIGQGSTAQTGWYLGNIGSGYAAIWNTGVTPSGSNYGIQLGNNGDLFLNATSGSGGGFIRCDNTTIGGWNASGIYAGSGLSVGFSNAFDPQLVRDASAILAQRSSTTAQTFRVYNTFTDASNYERGVLDWITTSNTLTIGTQKAGTGSARNLQFVIGGSVLFDYGVTSGNTWTTQGNWNVNFSLSNNASTGDTTIAQNNSLLWSTDVSISRTAAKVLRIGDAAANTNGWLQWAGLTRVSSDVNSNNT